MGKNVEDMYGCKNAGPNNRGFRPNRPLIPVSSSLTRLSPLVGESQVKVLSGGSEPPRPGVQQAGPPPRVAKALVPAGTVLAQS